MFPLHSYHILEVPMSGGFQCISFSGLGYAGLYKLSGFGLENGRKASIVLAYSLLFSQP